MELDYNSIVENHTWDLVDRPTKRKVIGTKWVYKTEYKSGDSLDKYKARLVAGEICPYIENNDYSTSVAVGS